MSDSSGINTPDRSGSDAEPEEKDLRGRYVEGNFGKAGAERGRRADDEEGQYIEGNYGEAGSEGGIPEPLGDKARESGRYVKANYGQAGSVPGRTAESEIGRYSEGNYGADGTVDPTRKAHTGKEAKPESTDPQ
ncbi:hypothetical protein [Arthrobacter sp. B3I4]|uniref:hypothetical protein n=1 Tax=Arthrobacter sp. B3I4 TaxID=3042267 RepID=UPI00278B7D3A|nr:hypothetical protein [Arthrobacter sp. B3I4]MDQ0754187.1 hypothetical protein [Arthrobacter sp. B3I4]